MQDVTSIQRLTLWKFETAIGWSCKWLISSDLGGGSSGWIRTSNTPVNSRAGDPKISPKSDRRAGVQELSRDLEIWKFGE